MYRQAGMSAVATRIFPGGGAGMRLGTAQPVNATRPAHRTRVVGAWDLERSEQPRERDPALAQLAQRRMRLAALRRVDDRTLGVEDTLRANGSTVIICGTGSFTAPTGR